MNTKSGDIFEIYLDGGVTAYAQALEEPEFAFYKLSPMVYDINHLMFRIWVNRSAIKDWKKIGNKPIASDLKEEIPRFKKDIISGNYSIYISGIEKEASFDQVKNMECAAVWEGNHVKDRLSDHLSNRKNIWLESLKPKDNG